MAPTFSVVIPLHNKARSVCSTIASVMNQTCADYEVIVVDDGSTDGSPEAVTAAFGDRVTLVRQANKGVSSARNAGISMARGKFVALLDADDMWDPGFLSTILEMIDTYPEARVFGTRYRYQTASSTYLLEKTPMDGYFDYFGNEKRFCASTVAIARGCFEKAGMFNEALSRGEDLDMWERLAVSHKIAVTTKVLATYRMDAENRACTRPLDLDKTYMYNRESIRRVVDSRHRGYLERLVKERALDVAQLCGLRAYWRYLRKHFGVWRGGVVAVTQFVTRDIRT
jgi:glycosyltransferase involved in cell wall biosynthesis